MIFFRIFLNRIVRASDFFFKRLCPFCAPLSRAFINVKALRENNPNFINISMGETHLSSVGIYGLHSRGKNVQPVLSSTGHFEKIQKVKP